MKIERINTYTDQRFSREVLFEHGAFLIDDCRPCSFKIRDYCSAVVLFDDYSNIEPIIEEFRFYAEHITVFYDQLGNKIAEYPPIPLKTVPLEEIQPSQFYVDTDKVQAVSTFIFNEHDIILPVTYDKRLGRYISLDGHTRMYYAYSQGWKTINVFESQTDSYIFSFVDEARNRGVFSAKDLIRLPHEEYVQKWDKFCDEFFTDNT